MIIKYFALFLPTILAYYTDQTDIKYMFAWLGSIYLIAYSILLCKNAFKERVDFFSPIVLSQTLFWGYTGLTSIFYFFDQKGYEFFEKVLPFENASELQAIANAQTYIVFGHSCYLLGYFLIKTSLKKPKYSLSFKSNTYLVLSVYAIFLAFLFKLTPISQISSYLTLFSTLCGVRYFGAALKHKLHIPLATIYLIIILIAGFLSGMKENTLYPLIFIGFIMYEYFGILKTSVIFVPIMVLYFYYIPVYNNKIRDTRWYDNKTALETFDIVSNVEISEDEIKNNNWGFLTTRLSEISMLNAYIESVPNKKPYYDFEIIGYGLTSLIPRFIWPDKPSPDETAQQRAVENGALILNSAKDRTSAKPQTIADAYLSRGAIGVAITFLILGIILKLATNFLYSKLGYELGISVLFYSLFSILSRGGSFENLFNTIAYGFILVYVWIEVLKKYNLIKLNSS